MNWGLQENKPSTHPSVGKFQAEEAVAPPLECGIASAVQDLMAVAGNIRNTADNLRSGLGIATQKDTGAQHSAPSGLRDVILHAVVIHAADNDLAECLRHLNS